MNTSATGGPATQEQTMVTGIFGTVTNKRVIYMRSRGWLSGGSREDIALAHVTSVRLDTKRHILGAILFFLIGLGMLAVPTNTSPTQIGGAILLALAVLFVWGSPAVHVNTAGQDKNSAQSWPWHRKQASAFVEAIRQQIVQR
jgi:hypothetical protein